MRTGYPLLRAAAILASLAVVCLGFGDRLSATDVETKPAQADVSKSKQRQKRLADEKELIRLFADTLAQVRLNYVDAEVSDRELIEAAIQGMISKLDPYSNYIPPKDVRRFRKGIERKYVGIGIQVSVSERNGNLVIVSPLFGTPAWRAGLRAGDQILKINDTSTRGLSIDDSIQLMTGDVGTDVKITVRHPSTKKVELVTLKRERIDTPTVLGYRRSADGIWDFFCDDENKIGYVRVTAFRQNTAKNLATVVGQLKSEGVRALVLDLRFNPGGLLNEAIQVCDLFVRQGMIVSIEGRGTPSRSWSAQEAGTQFPVGFPVAVLVNRFSASAAEIVSACLQDNKVAVVVGERTWGKGSVQNVIDLEDGKSVLKLTTAGYKRPSGKNIHRRAKATDDEDWGVKPDKGFAIRYDNTEVVDLSFHFADLDKLTRLNVPPRNEEENTEEKPQFVDRQLNKALDYIQNRLTSVADETKNRKGKKVAAGVG